jgi:hypothetical protein
MHKEHNSPTIEQLAWAVLSASRKRFFRDKQVFRQYAQVGSDQLDAVEKKIRAALPSDLRQWLLAAGYGDIADEISFREEWFAAIESGELSSGAIFAQDTRGNYYAFDAGVGRVYFLSRSDSAFAEVSRDFRSFIEEVVRRDYKLIAWMDTVEVRPYKW